MPLKHVDNEVFTRDGFLYATTAGRTSREKAERAKRIARLHNFAESLIDRIAGYDKQCEDEDYTDTGDAWGLFNELRQEAEEILGRQ